MKKITVFVSALLLFFLSFITSALAVRVAVVLSEKDRVYQKIAEVYLQTLQKKYPDLKSLTFTLSEQDPETVRKQLLDFYPNVNFAVGKSAADMCGKLILFPFIYTMILNPVKTDLMDSAGKNKLNCTGIKVLINPKFQFEQLKKAIPGSKIIGCIYSSRNTTDGDEMLHKAKEAATQLGLTFEAVKVQNLYEISQKFRELVKKGIDTFWLQVDPNVLSKNTLEYFIQNCKIYEINLLTFNPNHVENGASIAVYIDYSQLGKQAAEITELILHGTPVDSIPAAEAQYTKVSLNPNFLFKKK